MYRYNLFLEMNIRHNLNETDKCKVLPNSRIATIYVICKKNNQYYVLTHKRSEVMTHPLEYSGPGGSIDVNKGENSYQAALRELVEEAGIENPPEGYLFTINNNNNNNTTINFVANYIFFCTEEEIKQIVKGPLPQFRNEVDFTATFEDLSDIIELPNTGHCLMNIRRNFNNPGLYRFFNKNLKYIYYNILNK